MEDQVRVIDRVFDILEQLAQADSPMTLAELCKATEMSKSTVHRLLSSMCARQYVEKRSDNTYAIGYKLVETVSTHINGLELLTESKPFLSQISHELELTTHLGILDHHDVIYIEKMDLYPNTRLYTQVGYRSPAYCSSIGKCLLACLSGDELEEALYRCEFQKFTPNTITDLRELKRVLRVVRKQGWAMDNEEYQLGHRCVGAPIFDYRGTAVAAVSASGSIEMLSDDRLDLVISQVRKAAQDISRRMGYVE
ncbi:IclR family transcriptional regulator [Cuneatibacter sp. NSJ-177]|uniref:IclR family transcriptional regulator n=1 Tax=Cuneatibacter sp. NSJ-177 TaxID=2931401 RepID=UPI001FD50F01|nr:IclR family transcriptional regulator [Cuneatibacter sp. NSJ-177]MCJ7834202.1 IclR family transcriptional regulator [Cuneatibacter sp. NSJ-177]